MEELVYIYTNNKLLREQHGTNPMAYYEKNMLFENSIFDVDENANENDSSSEDPIMLDESNEDEVKDDPFEFPHDDKIPFSRLLYDLTVW